MKKIAIVGTASTSLHTASNLDDSWTIYSCNGATEQLKRFDKHFELHGMDYLKGLPNPPSPDYFKMMATAGDKVVLNNVYKEFPDSENYPLEAIIDFVGKAYFNNTIAYMIAYALYKNPDLTDLALIGVDMAGDGEYVHQRPCCEFYLGFARARGVVIHIPDICQITKATHLYGFEEMPAYVISSRHKQKELELELQQMIITERTTHGNLRYKQGLHDAFKSMNRIYQ